MDNLTGVNPQGPTGTIIPETNSACNCNIFNSISSKSDISYRGSSWHGTAKNERENLGGNIIFENYERENKFEVEIVGRKNSVIWNHTYSNSIHVDLNHVDRNKLIPADLINIGSINDSSDICAIENIL